jgi:hypothetical protein
MNDASNAVLSAKAAARLDYDPIKQYREDAQCGC